MSEVRIGIVGGGGWLGQAIARGLTSSKVVAPSNLMISWRKTAPTASNGVFLTQDNADLAEQCDVIILSVRPEDWPVLAFKAADKLIISVMAGVSTARIIEKHDSKRVVRALPNAAAEVAASYTPFFAAPEVSNSDRALVRTIFSPCGIVDEVSSESQVDYFAGVTGTGPAYPALMALAIERDAIDRGIAADVARRAVRAMFIGAGRLFEASDDTSEQIIEAFMEYRGMTAAGLATMTAAGLDHAVRAGIAAAIARGQQMADQG